MESSLDLAQILDRLRQRDPLAKNELYEAVYVHMRRVAGRIMSESFPKLKNHHDVTSIVHDAWFNLDKALDSVDLRSESEFYRFVAHKVRQVLLTLVGKRNFPVRNLGDSSGSDSGLPESGILADSSHDPASLSQWTEFHEKIVRLEEPRRQIFEMHYYLDLPQARISEILGLPPKQVSRHWIAVTEEMAEDIFAD